MSELSAFLRDLKAIDLPNTTNPYANGREGRRRLTNLDLYLRRLQHNGSTTLLVAEAFGYRGGRVTGVPLASEVIVEQDAFFRAGFPELCSQYRPCKEVGAMKTEATATIVWRLFREMNAVPPPACWNILPVHPYDPARGPWSNRRPSSKEIAAGCPFAVRVIDLLKPATVIAVGRCAAIGLSRAGIDHIVVRHPSQGGASQFRADIMRILA